MANIKILAWNIQVYGPQKYAYSPNNTALIDFVSAVVNSVGANVLVLYETMTSLNEQICFNVNEGLAARTGATWDYGTVVAREGGDRESYGFFWNTNANFAPALDRAGSKVCGLADLQFPNNFSPINGRRAAYFTFRSADTNQYFTTTAYHAPPNGRAIEGIEALAKMPQNYVVGNSRERVRSRLLAGDYNLDVNVQPEYTWLTDPEPPNPPPQRFGQGAGCAPATRENSHLPSIEEIEDVWRWGRPFRNWSGRSTDYRNNLAIDNVFWRTPTPVGANGTVVDVLAEMCRRHNGVRTAAQNFVLQKPWWDGGGPAFPQADEIPPPLNMNLDFAGCSFLLYRYAVSDHLPVFLSVTI
jgi:hypothetical protein